MTTFKVWDPVICSEDEAYVYEDVLASSPEDAAEGYMEDFGADNVIEGSEYKLKVRDVTRGWLFDVTVAVDLQPVFTAFAARPAKDD